jgi:hypothetical protein
MLANTVSVLNFIIHRFYFNPLYILLSFYSFLIWMPANLIKIIKFVKNIKIKNLY